MTPCHLNRTNHLHSAIHSLLTTIQQEMKNVIKLLQQQSSSSVTTGVDKKAPLGGADVGRKPTLQRCATILKALFDLEAQIDRVPLSAASAGVKVTGGAKCAVLPGEWLIEALQKVGLNSFTVSTYYDIALHPIKYLGLLFVV
jgi:hypothetical protein